MSQPEITVDSTVVDAAKQLMENLSSDTTRTLLLDNRTLVQTRQRSLLLEAGEVQLRLAKGETVDSDRRSLLNRALTLVECYLMSLECALSKVDFLRLLLDPSSDTAAVQEQVDYQKMLEELLFVQSKHANKLLLQEPFLTTLVCPNLFDGVLKGFSQMCVAGCQ